MVVTVLGISVSCGISRTYCALIYKLSIYANKCSMDTDNQFARGPARMAKTRALLTETEREQIAGEHGETRKHQAASRIRSRIRDELPEDVALLAEHHPTLYDELLETVCEE